MATTPEVPTTPSITTTLSITTTTITTTNTTGTTAALPVTPPVVTTTAASTITGVITTSGNPTTTSLDSDSGSDTTLLIILVTVTSVLVIVIVVLGVSLYYYKCHRHASAITPTGKQSKSRPVSALQASAIKNLFARPQTQTHESHMLVYDNEVQDSLRFETQLKDHKINGNITSMNGKIQTMNKKMTPPSLQVLYDANTEEEKRAEDMFEIRDATGYFKDQHSSVENTDDEEETVQDSDKEIHERRGADTNSNDGVDETAPSKANTHVETETEIGAYKEEQTYGKLHVKFNAAEVHVSHKTEAIKATKEPPTEAEITSDKKTGGPATTNIEHDERPMLIRENAIYIAKPAKNRKRSYPRGLSTIDQPIVESNDSAGKHGERLAPINKHGDKEFSQDVKDKFEQTLQDMRRVRKIYKKETVLNTNIENRTILMESPESKRSPMCELLRQMTV